MKDSVLALAKLRISQIEFLKHLTLLKALSKDPSNDRSLGELQDLMLPGSKEAGEKHIREQQEAFKQIADFTFKIRG